MRHIKLFNGWINENVSFMFDKPLSIIRGITNLLRLKDDNDRPLISKIKINNLVIERRDSTNGNMSAYYSPAKKMLIVYDDVIDSDGLFTILYHEYQHYLQDKNQGSRNYTHNNGIKADGFPAHMGNGNLSYINKRGHHYAWGMDKKYGISRYSDDNNLINYYLSDVEIGSYFSQLYIFFEVLINDDDKKSEALKNLRNGNLQKIFCDLPSDYMEKKIFTLYFGSQNSSSEITEDRIKTYKKITDLWLSENIGFDESKPYINNFSKKSTEKNIIPLKKLPQDGLYIFRNYLYFLFSFLQEFSDIELKTYGDCLDFMEKNRDELNDKLIEKITGDGILKVFNMNWEGIYKKFKKSLYSITNEPLESTKSDNAITYIVSPVRGHSEDHVKAAIQNDPELIKLKIEYIK